MVNDLATAATALAPSRPTTNFFDPADGQNVIARYANLQPVAQAAEYAANATDRMDRRRISRITENRQTQLWDRQSRDEAEREDYKLQRGTFLTQIAAIDPEADDYEDQKSAILSKLPMAVQRDDALHAILAGKDQIASQRSVARQRDLDRQEAADEWNRRQQQTAMTRVLLDGLTPEDIDAHTGPDGNIDYPSLYHLAGVRKSERRVDTAGKTAQARRDVNSLSAADKATRKAAQDSLADLGAFPEQRPFVRGMWDEKTKKNPYAGLSDEEIMRTQDIEGKSDMRNAVAWDADRFESELVAAAKRDNPEDYVNLVKDLTPQQKAHRRRMWEVARREFPAESPAPTANPTKLQDSSGLPAPRTVEERNALPSGTQYRGPDGNLYIKK